MISTGLRLIVNRNAMRHDVMIIVGLAAIALLGCEKPVTDAPGPAGPPAPALATGSTAKPAPTPLGGISDDVVVASLSEADRVTFHAARKNPTVDVRVALLAVSYGYQKRGQHEDAARVLRRVVELYPEYGIEWEQLAIEPGFFCAGHRN